MIEYVQAFDEVFVPLFTRALKQKTSFLEALLTRHAVRDGVYHCLTDNKYLSRKSDVYAREVADGRRRAREFLLFSNPLAVGVGEVRERWSLPIHRLRLGRLQIFTFEFDLEDVEFFAEQLRWCMPLKAWEKSPLGRLYREMKKYADFKLLTAVWSGNKSIHIHIVFETAFYRAFHDEPEDLQHGHHAHWMALLPTVMDILAPSGNAAPDHSLSWQTEYRRTPNASRKLDAPNLLGQPKGALVPQLVLWERAVERSPSTTPFLSPQRFIAPATRPRGERPSRQGRLTANQVRHCEFRLRDHYDGCPVEFVRLHWSGDEYRALFRNSPQDRNPASYLAEEFVLPRLVGRDAEHVVTSDIRPLDAPLGVKLAEWCGEIVIPDRMTGEQKERARRRVRTNLPVYTALLKHQPMILTAPEGVSKTTSIINDHKRIDAAINPDNRPAMYSFPDYENAEQKCETFNQRWSGSKFVGIVWRSWSRWYSETAEMCGKPVLSDEEASKKGISLWKLVAQAQPEVLEDIRREHRSIWAEVGDRRPVLFTVHGVAQRWGQNGRTRQMFDRDFFDAPDGGERRSRSALSLLVHDEVSISDLVHILSPDEKGWLDRLRAGSGDVWDGYMLAQQRKAYDRHKETEKGDQGVKFIEVRDLMSTTFEAVTLRDTGEYPCFKNYDIYRCAGEKWFVGPRLWWMEGERRVADRIVLLTTEQVPTCVASKAIDGILATSPKDLPLGRDPLTVTAMRGVKSEHADDLTADLHNNAEWQVIGNKLSKEAANTMSHEAARGRNDLADKSILHLATMLDPDRFRQLQALNAWTGRDDLALLAHVDQINQTTGRNRGFRNNGRTKHRLLINRTLFYALLARPDVVQALRYQFHVVLTDSQKKHAQEDRSAYAAEDASEP